MLDPGERAGQGKPRSWQGAAEASQLKPLLLLRICPGCSRGCAVSVHTSTRRPWHNRGRRVARIKPRYNPEVNSHWICDEGRYGFFGYDDDRLGKVMRLKPAAAERHRTHRRSNPI